MAKLNPHYKSLRREYIFPIIEKKLAELKQHRPDASIVNLGVGDIALPLAPSIISAICKAVEEMGRPQSIRGYGPTEGYPFLREAIAANEYAHLGIGPDEIFISEGTNSDTANILELSSSSNVIGIPDPTYPVYLDNCIMDGRKNKIIMLPCTEASGFLPLPPQEHCDLVYLCSPSNPTGVAMTKDRLEQWVRWAQREKAILLLDNAYAAFVSSSDVPRSIFEIDGAKEVAIEFRSFSKSAGFTGLRCAYTVLPKSVHPVSGKKPAALHAMWDRRQATKTNGVSYPIQKGAESVYSPQGQIETRSQVKSYLHQAKILREGLKAMGYHCWGGMDSPYIWWKTPNSMSSWNFFDLLLEKCHLISIPGKGFGVHGEGYVRLSAFTTEDKAEEALQRIKNNI
ncbi:MAG TPA: LL-diaminopimelate aminotransferase [Rhabdochlamydiaceae bacterium]|nr:LL-diaminopimelate aminotransferase [Rhabdochlamydiaceae bacterium]